MLDLKRFIYGCWINWKEFLHYLISVRYFYHNFFFACSHFQLSLHYLLNNPYRLCQKTRSLLPNSLTQPYGETPLLDFSRLIHTLPLTSEDRFIELGCGCGHIAFWLAHFTPCSILAVDIVPEFIRYGNELAQRRGLKRLLFEYNNMLEVDFSSAHYIYLYGTSLEDSYIVQLIEKFKQLPIGATVITTSYSLLEYGAKDFILENRLPVHFIWGESDFYIQRKVKN